MSDHNSPPSNKREQKPNPFGVYSPKAPTPATPPRVDVQRQYVIIGIDFGTTFSGVSWTWSGNLETTDQIHAWRAVGRDRDSDKVPTRIIYDGDGRARGFGFDEPVRYDDVQIEWFKLLLSDKAITLGGDKVKEAQSKLKVVKKTAVQVTADYLGLLWTHTIEQLELKLTKIALKHMDFRVILTHPANWDHKAEARTREAAELAGIIDKRADTTTTLRLVSEPEAAALAAWQEAGFPLRPDIEIGDSFTVCDAGGGTVDLISYTIESLEPFKLRMCVKPTGGLCGAVYLDEAFQNALVTAVGREQWNTFRPEVRHKVLSEEWEHGLKRRYTGGRTQHCSIYILGYKPPRSGFLHRRKVTNTIDFDSDQIDSMFRPTCDKVLRHLKAQTDEVKEETLRPPKAIILVGGFSENDYLLKSIQDSAHRIPVQRPTKAWAAISRGAVVKGQSNTSTDDVVTNVITKYSYGIHCWQIFNPKRHKREDLVVDPVTGDIMAKDQISWFIKRGADLKKQKPIVRPFHYSFKSKWTNPEMPHDVYVSEIEHPPHRIEKGVEHCCTLRAHVSPWVYNELEILKSPINDILYRHMTMNVEVRVTSDDLEWKIKHGDKLQGSATLAVEYNQPLPLTMAELPGSSEMRHSSLTQQRLKEIDEELRKL